MTKSLVKLILVCMLLNILLISVHTQWVDDSANKDVANSNDNDNNNGDNNNNKENDGNFNDDTKNQDQDEEEQDDEVVDEQWDCNHDKEEHAEPELEEVDEDGFKDRENGNDNKDRRLAATNMRFYGYYGFMSGSSSYVNYLKNWLMPPILSYFENALKVRYPVSGALKVTTNSICGHSTPSVLRNGVNADFVYIFSSVSGVSWVASTSNCKLATGSRRPLIAETTVNTGKFLTAFNNVLLHEKNMLAIMHELTHALGFSSSLFKYFLGGTGKGASVVSGSVGGKSTTVLVASPLTEMVRSHFGCSSARGGFLENNGAFGAVAGSHFERRLFGAEAMTGYLLYDMRYSKFTLGLLESSGWYYPDYSYADPHYYGQGQGCNFISASCASANSAFSDFCTTSARKCTSNRRGGGTCSSDTVSDGCKFIHAKAEYDCGSPSASSYARLPSIQTFGRGTGSKCFEGTLGGSSSTTFCFKYSCSGSVLNIQVGGRTVECTGKGSKTVAGYSGSINCPDPARFCSTIGKALCPRGCMGRGRCNNGKCSCYSGFKGEDCALPA